jgi:hypothetical protein
MYKQTEIKGDITFYKDDKGKLYQKIQDNEIFPVRNGVMAYKLIHRVGGIEIKYNLNGVHGFCVFKRHSNLEDNIWSLNRAIEIAKELNK